MLFCEYRSPGAHGAHGQKRIGPTYSLFLWALCVPFISWAAADEKPAALRIHQLQDEVHVQIIAKLPAKSLDQIPEGKVSADEGERCLNLTLVEPGTGKEAVAVLGSYERRREELILTPRYALAHGHKYRATLKMPGGETTVAEYRVPERRRTTSAVVEKVYPTAEVLPANQLKFYIHFSKPMRESSEIFDQVVILDGQGKTLPDPWRRTELWSADAKRLTLFIHPGRVKKGVNLREDLGPVLQPNQTYTLRIDAAMLDAGGQPLGKPFTKQFRTSAELHARPVPEEWKVRAPTSGTRQPLKLDFPAPLDRALLDRFLTVQDTNGKAIHGKIEVGFEERFWIFRPESEWKDSEYTIKVSADLEDLAGNTPERLFDVDMEEAALAPPRLILPFKPSISANKPARATN